MDKNEKKDRIDVLSQLRDFFQGELDDHNSGKVTHLEVERLRTDLEKVKNELATLTG